MHPPATESDTKNRRVWQPVVRLVTTTTTTTQQQPSRASLCRDPVTLSVSSYLAVCPSTAEWCGIIMSIQIIIEHAHLNALSETSGGPSTGS